MWGKLHLNLNALSLSPSEPILSDWRTVYFVAMVHFALDLREGQWRLKKKLKKKKFLLPGMRVFESEPVRRPAWHFYHVRDPWSLNIQQGLTFRGRDVLHILQECFFLSVEWYINYESCWRSKTNMISLTKNKTEIERIRASAENPQNFYILPQNTFSNKYRQKLSKIKIVKLVFGQKIMYYF